MKNFYFGKILLLIIIIMTLLFIICLYEPKKQNTYKEENKSMVNEVLLVGKVAYYPIFSEIKEQKIGKIGILVVEKQENMTSFNVIECEGNPEKIEKFKKSDKVIVYGKLKNDNNKLKVIITEIKGV